MYRIFFAFKQTTPSNQFFGVCIIIRMETKAKLNELEFKARAKNIVSYFEMSIGTKEQKEYEFELAFERKQ